MINVILCGGSGTRLWPLSRKLLPKQFAEFMGDNSLFQETLLRTNEVCDSVLIVSNVEHYFMAKDQLEELPGIEFKKKKFVLEPIGRNTAPAIALACLDLEAEAVVLVTPSDHLIQNKQQFHSALKEAKKLAEQNYLVTFGIVPDSPETGYGYIKASGNDVEEFIEKPPLTDAEKYLAQGGYYWNSGMFCFKASVYLEELKKHAPEIYSKSVEAYQRAKGENDHLRVDTGDMENIPSESIDYAVMEKSDRVRIVYADMGWSDVGSFDSLYEALPKDEQGNTPKNHLIIENSKNNLILSDNKMVALIDVDGLNIIDTPDALLIASRGSSQKIKKVVEMVKEVDQERAESHVTTHRPWGSYTILEKSEGYKIKRIVVRPKKRLSLQKHVKRSEHWVVVNGTALVTVGDREFTVLENESTYIPKGEIHRLTNPGEEDLVVIEAQVGDYLGEDDIIRIEDDYRRD